MKPTKKELEVMKCLWNQAPLSCDEILQSNKAIMGTEKAVHELLRSLQKKNMVYIAETRPATRKPIQLYAPSITSIEYMNHEITSNIMFNADTLPLLFQSLIKGVRKKETMNQIYDMVEKARRELK